MKWFYDLKIGTKMPVIFCLLAAITTVTGWIGYSTVGRLRDSGARLYAERLLAIQGLADANIAFANQRINQREIVISSNPEKRGQLNTDIDTETRTLEERIEAYGGRSLAPQEKELLDQFRATW